MSKTELDFYICEYKRLQDAFFEGGMAFFDHSEKMREIEEKMGIKLYLKYLDHLWNN